MNCSFCHQPIEAMKSRNVRMNGQRITMHVCVPCNAFYAVSDEDNIIRYYFICTEIVENPTGNFIVEFDVSLNTTTIKFLPIDEEKQDLETIYTFDYLLPLTPENITKKIKTYVLFS